jgi:hypothetical protein
MLSVNLSCCFQVTPGLRQRGIRTAVHIKKCQGVSLALGKAGA